MGRPKKIRLEDIVKVDEVNEVKHESSGGLCGHEKLIPVESVEIVLPEGEGYVPMTVDQVELAQSLGVLAGWDPLTMTGLISKGDNV